MTPITLDFSNMVMERLGAGGIDPDRLGGDLADRFRTAHEQVEASRRSGEMGFFELPYDSDGLGHAQELADRLEGRFENLVIIGIGGSALGARTLRDALLGPLWNERSNEEREGRPRMYILDNVDPGAVLDAVEHLDLRRTLFNVVSKSGSTAETMALYLVIEGLLIEEVGTERAGEHFVFTTDPENGALRSIAEAEGIESLPIPGNVGGRFSVLSPVGLFPGRSRRRGCRGASRWRRAGRRVLPNAGAAREPGRTHGYLASHGSQRIGGLDPCDDALLGAPSLLLVLVSTTLGRVSRKGSRSLRQDRPHGTDAAAGGGGHGSACPGTAVHRGASGQSRHLPCAHRGAGGT